jgi:hypothetical protein
MVNWDIPVNWDVIIPHSEFALFVCAEIGPAQAMLKLSTMNTWNGG